MIRCRRYPVCPVCGNPCEHCAADDTDLDELSDEALLADVLRKATPVADDEDVSDEELARILKAIGGPHVA
jgi:hypothetical protein